MRSSTGTIVVIATLLVLPTAGFSWNSTGHRVVALVAYKSLDADTKNKVCDILKNHPAADSLWANRHYPLDEGRRWPSGARLCL